LADDYPACFSVDPGRRRPLKNTILADLKAEGATDEMLSGAEYYMRHFGYRRNVQAGTERIGLNGKKAGVVTEAEAQATQRQMQEEKEELARKKIGEVPGMKKVAKAAGDAAPAPVKCGVPVPIDVAAPVDPLARLQRLLATTATLYAGTEDEVLRHALAVTALKQIVDEATRAITALDRGE
jgi:sRNA-binding protein